MRLEQAVGKTHQRGVVVRPLPDGQDRAAVVPFRPQDLAQLLKVRGNLGGIVRLTR